MRKLGEMAPCLLRLVNHWASAAKARTCEHWWERVREGIDPFSDRVLWLRCRHCERVSEIHYDPGVDDVVVRQGLRGRLRWRVLP